MGVGASGGPRVTREQRRLAAIVSVDVVGYSRLMGADEAGTLQVLRAHRQQLIDPKIAAHGRYVTFQMAEVAVSRRMFGQIPARIARLRAPPMPV